MIFDVIKVVEIAMLSATLYMYKYKKKTCSENSLYRDILGIPVGLLHSVLKQFQTVRLHKTSIKITLKRKIQK